MTTARHLLDTTARSFMPLLAAGLLASAAAPLHAQASFASPIASAPSAVMAAAAAHPSAAVVPAVNLKNTPDISLLVSYQTINIANDGVVREVRYNKIMHRQNGKVWIEKEVPQPILDSLAHGHIANVPRGPHAGHAHTEAQDAPIFVQRPNPDSRPQVQVVLRKLEQLIEVEPAHHSNVGYNGSWDATYWLITPHTLQQLTPVGQANDGVQLYRRFEDESMTEIAWNNELQFPQKVLRRGAHNTTYYKMTATPIETPKDLPWTQLSHYARGDYSDLLD